MSFQASTQRDQSPRFVNANIGIIPYHIISYPLSLSLSAHCHFAASNSPIPYRTRGSINQSIPSRSDHFQPSNNEDR